MLKMRGKKWFAAASVALALSAVSAKAGDDLINPFFVKAELYIWNRIADLNEIIKPGVALGPALGAEIAITDYMSIGAYRSYERGVEFYPIWLVSYLDEQDVFRGHGGHYGTASFADMRSEITTDETTRFTRSKYGIRAQIAPVIGQLYVEVDPTETGDFLAGLVGLDPKNDDQEPDPTVEREPAAQLGRGVCNVLFGIAEIPKTMMWYNRYYGDLTGASTGLFKGIWRFGVREVVGVMEIVTFPMGWAPIVEPEFVFMPVKTTEWRLNSPQFREKF